MDWFLLERNLRHEKVKQFIRIRSSHLKKAVLKNFAKLALKDLRGSLNKDSITKTEFSLISAPGANLISKF